MLKKFYVRSRGIHVNEDLLRLAASNDQMAEAVREGAELAKAAMGMFAGKYRYSVPSFPASRFDLPWRERYVGKCGGATCEAEFTQILPNVHTYAIELLRNVDGSFDHDHVVVPSSDQEWIQTLAVETICYVEFFLDCAEIGDESAAWTWWTRGIWIFNEMTWRACDLVKDIVPDEWGNMKDAASLRRLADT